MERGELVLPTPNQPLPLWVMEPVTLEDRIPGDAMPTGIRDAYKKGVLWGWTLPLDQKLWFYWLNREPELIAVIWMTWNLQEPFERGTKIVRQSFLRRCGAEYKWADVFSPDVQDALRNWMAFGVLAGGVQTGKGEI